MTEGPARRDRAAAADLEYDLSHEAEPADVVSQRRPRHPRRPATVATETSDSAGDYGYDLAHDIPRQRG